MDQASGSAEKTSEPIVYFVAAWENQRIKIGTTTMRSLNCRMAALKSASSVDLQLVGYQPGDREVERAMHRRFAAGAAGGEWFHFSDELWDHIEQNTTNHRESRGRTRAGGIAKKMGPRRDQVRRHVPRVAGGAPDRIEMMLRLSCDQARGLHDWNVAQGGEAGTPLDDVVAEMIRRHLGRWRKRQARQAAAAEVAG